MIKVTNIVWDPEEQKLVLECLPGVVEIDLNYYDSEEITDYLEQTYSCKVLDYEYWAC